MTQQSLTPLLQSIIRDNNTFKFPIESISKELTSMFIEPLEFDYFRIQAFRKLRKDFGNTIAHIFLQTLEIKLKLTERDIYTLSIEEYQSELESFLDTLEKLYITKIDKHSPDGEMMSAMV